MQGDRPSHRHNVPAARELRTRQTPAEVALWTVLRNRQLDGLKFRRQHPIGPFVLDFCSPECHLAIELDGDVHALQQDRDAAREMVLEAAGYRVLRFPNELVLSDLPSVVAEIRAAANNAAPRYFSHPGRRRGT